MKRLLPIALLASLALAACGDDPETTPVACLAGAEAYAEALEGAPEQALVGDSVPLSDCLIKDQPAGQLGTVGSSLIEVATELNREARKRPRGEAAVQLGYLVGSVEQAASASGGQLEDLVLRVNAAARFSEDGGAQSAAFERSFGAGYAAARDQA